MTVHWEHPDDPRLFLRSAYIRAAGNRQFHAPPTRGTRGSHRNLRIAHPDPPPRDDLRSSDRPIFYPSLHVVDTLGPRQCHGCSIRFRCHPNSRARYCHGCVAGRADIVRIVVLMALLVVIVAAIMWAGTAVSGG